MEKTNVIRLLEQKKISFVVHSYGNGEALPGIEVAKELNQSPDCVFKTLVTQGISKQYYVFMIPVNCELSMKKAAAAVKEKSVSMIKQTELLPLTGYVHGGCSPIGMKKQFRTFIHETADQFENIYFSAGKIGYQVEMAFSSLEKMVPIKKADLVQ